MRDEGCENFLLPPSGWI